MLGHLELWVLGLLVESRASFEPLLVANEGIFQHAGPFLVQLKKRSAQRYAEGTEMFLQHYGTVLSLKLQTKTTTWSCSRLTL
jgi:hypothetical protein